MDTVQIIGAPTDYGTNRRGVDMGPSAIRYAGLADELADADIDPIDAGDLLVRRVEQRQDPADASAKYLDEVESVCRRLADEVADAIDQDRFPLVLGGDHSIAIGTMAGAARDADIGVLWFDAHADFNTPDSSPSGNIHGMPLAAALGHGRFEGMEWATAPTLDEENVVWVGLRTLDDSERDALRASDGTAYTMTDIDERGITDVVADAIDVASDGVDGLHVSLDLDWLDPQQAPGVGTPVRGGVTYREAHAAMELVADHAAAGDGLRSMELVEVNPILDTENRTAELATEFAASALGKRIL